MVLKYNVILKQSHYVIPEDKIIEIYFMIDEFNKEFDKVIKEHTLEDSKKRKRNRKFTLFGSEVMTILVLFQSGAFKNLKIFFICFIFKNI